MDVRRSFGLALSAVVLTGCMGPPRGDSGGRIDPYETTAADVFSTGANVPDMLAFGDRVGEQLAQRLMSIPEIANAPHQVVLELGTIENKTRTPLSDFEMLQKRLHRAIQRSSFLRNHILVVESRARMEYEMSRIQGAAEPDLLQDGAGGGTRVQQYDPRYTYVLQGDFYETVRNNARRYWFNFQLVNLQSRAVVFTEDFDGGNLNP